jgi:hypothetical protein
MRMAARASYQYMSECANDSALSNDSGLSNDNDNGYLSTTMFKRDSAYPTTSSTSDTMATPNSLMPTSSDAHSMSMNAFAGFAGNSTAWGQHAMDFSGVFNANGPPSWAWPNDFGQSGQFNVRNGLTTPPKDPSSPGMVSGRSFGMETDAIDPNEVMNHKKRTRKMSKAGIDNGKGKASRKPQKNNKIPLVLEDLDEEGEDEDEDKREKFLERNRVAASKCRQKKKAWTNNLEERARELTSQRQMLSAHVAMLRNELLELKCKCLEHTSCECEQIRDYLKNTVAALQPAPAALYHFQQQDLRRESTGSETASTGDNVNAASRQSSVSVDSPLDYLKIEDDMRTTLAQSLNPKLGGNGYKN